MRLRSLLFAPAVRPDLIAKLPRAGADAVVIDCEDATPPASKAEGRENARRLGAELTESGTNVFVRVNGVETPWFDDDVRALGGEIAGIVVPMVERTDQLDRVADRLERAVVGLETAAGVAAAQTLLAHPVVAAGYFGAEDFIADMGGVRTDSNLEVLMARSAVALAGRLAGVPVLDQVVVEFGNATRFRREAEEARSFGYAGKLCIHPSQVAIAHEVFTPSAAEIEAARRVVAAHDAGEKEGRAVVVVDGRMIDGPLVAQARKVLAAADEG